jgi:hypothetical protein
MKTIYFTDRGPIEVNEKGEPTGVRTSREAISNIVAVKEPTHLVYNRGNKRVELDAQDGDIVVTFYESAFETPMVVVNSKEWLNNILSYEKREQEQAEAWAKKQAEKQENTEDLPDNIA